MNVSPKAAARGGKFWARLCALPAFSFLLNGTGGVARVKDPSGNWVELSEVQQIIDDAECRIAELEAQAAAQSLQQIAEPAVSAVPGWEAAAPKIAMEIARNCGSVPQLVYPDLYLGLKDLFSDIPKPDAPALAQAARDVLEEVERARRRFPTWPTDPLHALAVLGEEFGELTKDVLQLTYEPNKTTAERMRNEALQTAAMALRFYVSLPFYKLTPGAQHDPAALAVQKAAEANP